MVCGGEEDWYHTKDSVGLDLEGPAVFYIEVVSEALLSDGAGMCKSVWQFQNVELVSFVVYTQNAPISHAGPSFPVYVG
jgi:hypothetical protein